MPENSDPRHEGSLMVNGDTPTVAHAENEAVRAEPAECPEVGFPRQYGLRTMMIVTTIYAILFALLASLGAPPVLYAVPAIFIAAVALGQAFLFKGTRPREASLIVGSGILILGEIALVSTLYASGSHGDAALLWSIVVMPAIGAVLGYLVGGAIAGPFLIAEHLRQRRSVEPPADDAEME